MGNKFSETMFTESVKAVQEHYGSRKHYAKFEGIAPEPASLSDAEIDFIESRDGFYIATVNEDLQPYIQFRGGPAGFLKVLDERTLAYADFRGNLQYISVGNLRKNDKAALFLMDYATRRRLKILARVEVKDADEVPELIRALETPGYKAKIERAVTLHVEAFDWNCPQHITPRFTIDEVKRMAQPLYEHIEKLKAEIQRLTEDLTMQKN
jgi:predicted pyridoxine 5'-phosphate oxidase superfamily flavin-nucleotide-binding protein